MDLINLQNIFIRSGELSKMNKYYYFEILDVFYREWLNTQITHSMISHMEYVNTLHISFATLTTKCTCS